jgi:hypothetical protein
MKRVAHDVLLLQSIAILVDNDEISIVSERLKPFNHLTTVTITKIQI